MATTASRIRLTAGRVDDFTCPAEKSQAFLWDTDAPTLMLRATPTGRKTYAFESRLNGKTIRVPIGTIADWSLGDARTKARELSRLVDQGIDPRDVQREKQEAREAKAAQDVAESITVGAIWPEYLANGSPKRKDAWKPRYKADLTAMGSEGGKPKKRGKGLTRPGPIYPLRALKLIELDEDTLQVWYEREAKTSKHQAARALMMFRGFLRWCASQPQYRKLVDRDAGRAPAILDQLPKTTSRKDVLETAQVRGWWSAVEQLPNKTASVYLRALLLTGARKEEMATLRWEQIDFRWHKLTLADKVDASRTIPLTPYLAQILAGLPRKSAFVFASIGKAGRIVDARASHSKALAEAGIAHLTFHGLRRAFIQRGRAVAPAGTVAQIAGHKPSATAEGYAEMPLDDLRPYAAMVEKHILDLAGVVFDAVAEPGKLQLVQG